jgi:hypothetical protein
LQAAGLRFSARVGNAIGSLPLGRPTDLIATLQRQHFASSVSQAAGLWLRARIGNASGPRTLRVSAGIGAGCIGEEPARAVIETACDISGVQTWIGIASRPGASGFTALGDTILVEEQRTSAVGKATRADDVRPFGTVVLARHFPTDGAEIVDQVLDRRTAVVDELRFIRVRI